MLPLKKKTKTNNNDKIIINIIYNSISTMLK